MTWSLSSGGTASSWNTTRLVATGVLMAAAALILSVGLAGLVNTDRVGAADTALAAVETDIGTAVAAVREGAAVPALTEHLAVVQVSVTACGSRSTGSGVVVADGLLLTAAHVVGDAGLVRLDHGGVVVTGEVLGVLGDDRDVALIELDAPMSVPVPFGPMPAAGEPITLVGYPDAGPLTVHVGPRVDIAPQIDLLAGPGEIVGVDISTSAGISGGPAIGADGEIVGLVIAKEAATDTALVLAISDLDEIRDAALIPGTCDGTA